MSSFDIKSFVKKPVVFVVGVILILILLFSLIFGGGGGEDPMAKSVKNLSNKNQALVSVIDSYGRGVKSANLRSNLSQVSIILVANKNDLDTYFSTLSVESKKVKASVSIKPKEEVLESLDEARISNNLDSELKSFVKSELISILESTQNLKKNYPDKVQLSSLVDSLVLNTQTVIKTVDQAR